MSVATRVLVVGSVASTALFSALAAWAQPGRSKTLHIAAPRSQVRPGQVARVGGFVTRGATNRPVTQRTSVTAPQTVGTQGVSPADQLSPPTTAPDTVPATVPAPFYQDTSPPPVVSGAS